MARGPGEIPEVRGRRALVYSMGMEGQDLARWLIANGAEVTMSDTRSDAALEAAGARAPAGVACAVTGKRLLDAAGFELVAVSQSVLRHDPAMERVRELGIPFTSQMRLFLQLCPGRVIGITGSSGKSTTTALVAKMASAAGIDYVVGGNIGEALLGRLPEITASTTVILEISHTQLQYTDRSPHIAAVTNVTPNHLDQFSWDEYVGLKRNILTRQGPDGVAVLSADDLTSRALIPSVQGSLLRTSIHGPVGGPGGWVEAGDFVLDGARERTLARVAESQLRGEHNVANTIMACVIAAAAGVPDAAIRAAIREFQGVPHRLEVVGMAGGAAWVNDSIATAPERTVAGLQAFREPVVLLLGGRDKRLPLDTLREAVRIRCRAVVCFGESGPLFFEAVRPVCNSTSLVRSLSDAVEAAASLARQGDVVLLSPAGTSFDAYPSFEVRGQAFRDLVRALPGFQEAIR